METGKEEVKDTFTFTQTYAQKKQHLLQDKNACISFFNKVLPDCGTANIHTDRKWGAKGNGGCSSHRKNITFSYESRLQLQHAGSALYQRFRWWCDVGGYFLCTIILNTSWALFKRHILIEILIIDVHVTNYAIMSIWTKISEESMPPRIKAVLKEKMGQPGTSKVYLIKWSVSGPYRRVMESWWFKSTLITDLWNGFGTFHSICMVFTMLTISFKNVRPFCSLLYVRSIFKKLNLQLWILD